MENSGYTNAPGKGFLKVSGILLIIFAAISIIAIIIGAVAAASLGSVGAVVGGIALVVGLISAAFSLVMGILGVKYANVPAKAQVCMVFAIIAIVLQLVSLITGGSNFISTLIGLVLPVLYLIGALKNKQIAA